MECICVAEAAVQSLVEDDAHHQPVCGTDLEEEVGRQVDKVAHLEKEKQFGVADWNKAGEERGEEEAQCECEL